MKGCRNAAVSFNCPPATLLYQFLWKINFQPFDMFVKTLRRKKSAYCPPWVTFFFVESHFASNPTEIKTLWTEKLKIDCKSKAHRIWLLNGNLTSLMLGWGLCLLWVIYAFFVYLYSRLTLLWGTSNFYVIWAFRKLSEWEREGEGWD